MKIYIILITYACFFLCIISAEVSQADNKKVDIFIDDDNYTRILRQEFKKQHLNLVAIMFTNKNCQTCESFQPELRDIQEEFLESQIPIFRCEISHSLKLSQKFKIKRFPMIHFVIKKIHNEKGDFNIRIYKTNQIVTRRILSTAKYLKKVLNYLNNMKNNTDKIKDLNLMTTLQEIPSQVNRIIINNDQLYKNFEMDEQKMIEQIVLHQSFNNMLVVPLSDELFSYYKVVNDIQISNKDDNNNNFINPQIIIVSIETGEQNQFRHIPVTNQHVNNKLAQQNVDLLTILKSFLLYSVQQFTEDIFDIKTKTQLVLNIQKPTYLAVLDSIWQRNRSLQHIDMLNRIMFQFEYQINIFWTQAQINTQKKALLGFSKSQQPPLFGKLILHGHQPKQPLKDSSTDNAIFSELEIRKRIRQDLGYQTKLAEKIKQLIEQLGLSEQVSVQDHTDYKDAPFLTIRFIFCAQHYLTQRQIETLYFIYSRFRKFYPNSKLMILTPPCLVNNQTMQQGLYMIFNKTLTSISSSVSQCIDIQQQIKQVSDTFALQINRLHLLPEHFCVPEQQMRDYLMMIQQQ